MFSLLLLLLLPPVDADVAINARQPFCSLSRKFNGRFSASFFRNTFILLFRFAVLQQIVYMSWQWRVARWPAQRGECGVEGGSTVWQAH